MNKLQSELATWDGKNTQALARVYQKHQNRSGLIDNALVLCHSLAANIDVAASWLVKHAVDDGRELQASQADSWLDLLNHSTSWPVLLHVLQTVQHLELTQPQIKSSWTAMKRLRDHQNRLVQTWALDAMARLADRHPPYRRTVRQMFGQIGDVAPASLRARVRNLRKAMCWIDAS